MGIALLGMDSEYSLDNGDISVKIVFQRSQIDKVIQRNIVGKFIIIIKNKQDIQCVHCNVTGSNDVTSKDPNFQLQMLFETCLYLVIEKLVCDGHPFEGFDPVIQGDNSGPHQDKCFYKYVVNFFQEKMFVGTSRNSDTTYECT